MHMRHAIADAILLGSVGVGMLGGMPRAAHAITITPIGHFSPPAGVRVIRGTINRRGASAGPCSRTASLVSKTEHLRCPRGKSRDHRCADAALIRES